MTKKGHQIFGEEKCTPPRRENPGYAYVAVTVPRFYQYSREGAVL